MGRPYRAKGFSLIEVVIAIAVFSTGLGGLSLLLMLAIQETTAAHWQAFAASRAQSVNELLLTLPVVYPAVIALNGGEAVTAAESAFGVSGVGCSIWFGIIVVKMAELCLITPPIGLNCFVVAGVRPECTVQDVFRGCMPFFVADVLTIAVLIMLPGIVLWLPGLMGFA